MQSFPLTPGDNARAAVYAKTSPEGQRIPVLSAEQQQVVDGIHRLQAAAAQDPALNGQASRLPRNQLQGLGFSNTGYRSQPYSYQKVVRT
jgi:hypothetical protein